MNISQITGIYFSPTGQTKQVTELFISAFPERSQTLDLTSYGKRPAYCFGENEAVAVGAPVYAGRIPETASRRFASLHGRRTPAILLVTYGNRAYDDALMELSDILKRQGFLPVAAAAVVARHSIVPEIAADRPDQEDIGRIKEFAVECEKLLKSLPGSSSIGELDLPGAHPLAPPERARFRMKVSGACNNCGTCIRECPEQVISRTDPRIMDEERCIGCMRCVALCETGARTLASQTFRSMRQNLKKLCSTPKKAEFFVL